jgi:hypothetical protein
VLERFTDEELRPYGASREAIRHRLWMLLVDFIDGFKVTLECLGEDGRQVLRVEWRPITEIRSRTRKIAQFYPVRPPEQRLDHFAPLLLTALILEREKRDEKRSSEDAET